MSAGAGGRSKRASTLLVAQSLRLRALLRMKGVSCSSVRCDGHLPLVHSAGEVVLGQMFAVRSQSARCEFGATSGGRLHIGDFGFINQGASVVATERIDIGDHCLVGDLAAIYDSNFHALEPSRGVAVAPITIGHNVWIGRATIVLPGCEIGDNSVVAAASVVRGVVPPNSLVAGNPAVVIRTLAIEPGWYRT